MQSVGAAWLMTSLTRSHQLIAMVQASNILPILLLGVFAGAIADNYDRRRIMLASQTGMLLVAATLSLVTWAGMMTPVVLIGLTLLLGIGTALNSPAWQASVRQQVAVEDLPQAISLNSVSFNLARTMGPALGGLLISLWNVSLTFGVNAISRPPMILALLSWHPEPVEREPKPIMPAVITGFRYCFGSLPIRRILMRGSAIGFGVAGYQALVPVVVRGQLHGNEIDYGLLLGMFGVGSIAAALVIGWARRRLGTEGVVTVATLAFAVAQVVLANAHSLSSAASATFIAGAGWVTGLTSLNVAMQMRSPEAILGRCLSIYQAVTFGCMALGSWFWGAVADWYGLGFALHAAAVFLLLGLVVLRVAAPIPPNEPHPVA